LNKIKREENMEIQRIIRKKTKTGRTPHEKVCLNCKRAFLSNRTTAKVCSDSCRVENHRKQSDMKKKSEYINFLKEKYGI
jgi:hypothetical protein